MANIVRRDFQRDFLIELQNSLNALNDARFTIPAYTGLYCHYAIKIGNFEVGFNALTNGTIKIWISNNPVLNTFRVNNNYLVNGNARSLYKVIYNGLNPGNINNAVNEVMLVFQNEIINEVLPLI